VPRVPLNKELRVLFQFYNESYHYQLQYLNYKITEYNVTIENELILVTSLS